MVRQTDVLLKGFVSVGERAGEKQENHTEEMIGKSAGGARGAGVEASRYAVWDMTTRLSCKKLIATAIDDFEPGSGGYTDHCIAADIVELALRHNPQPLQ